MAKYDAIRALPDGKPGPWGNPVSISYNVRDVLLYAVGIGITDLRFIYENHSGFSVFPTFAIRWGGAGAPVDTSLIPGSPGPLNIDAERYLEVLGPLPTNGTVSVRSRLIGVHPKGTGNGFCEYESIVTDENGNDCIRMVNGSFRRGVKQLGDIEPFEGSGETFSQKIVVPESSPSVVTHVEIAENQAQLYRLSGDYNSLHIDPDAAKFGGFESPILHGLCTFGHCAQSLLSELCDGDPSRFRRIKVRFSSPVYPGDTMEIRAWSESSSRVIFEARVGDSVVVSNAYFEFD